MNRKVLLTIGGVINLIFGLFHLFLGYMLHTNPNIPEGFRPLMEMLNAGGALMIFFMAFASLFYKEEMLTTKLGRLVIILTLLLYWSRAVEEATIAAGFSAVIFTSCILVGIIYFLLLIPSKDVTADVPEMVR